MKHLFHRMQFKQNVIQRGIKRSFNLHLTKHSKQEAKNDKYGSFTLPTKLPKKFIVAEVEQTNGINTKYVLEYPYNSRYNITIVIIPYPEERKYVVKTAWLNSVTDNHPTLDVSRYSDVSHLNTRNFIKKRGSITLS